MEKINYFEQSLRFDTKDYKKSSFTTTAPEFYININYSCTPRFSDWVVLQDSDEPQLLRRTEWPTTMKIIRISLEEFLSKEKAHKIVGDAIKKWPVWVDARPLLIDYVLEKAREAVDSMPTSHKAVHLNLRVISELKHVFDERYGIGHGLMGKERDHKCMIPAAESNLMEIKLFYHSKVYCI
ncbi:hypothetical protein CDL12_23772 [Handroanthus impetiginosus]|uniref:Uncharacterized protein n=1 Tax=Handroanthus impetiginosus TaxID=429701 RepID=A0A2G9GEJ3_9LAMI|nr:hypothetical protein CDL12_23772 [Handroanthus impetiginosus]